MLVLPIMSLMFSRSAPWPKVTPLEHDVQFFEEDDPCVDLVIRDRREEPASRLECHDGRYHDGLFSYSGLFACRLTQSGPDRDLRSAWDLLSDESRPRHDWQSRGRFLPEQLAGVCGGVPEYGSTRTFRLRGMALSLRVSTHPGPAGEQLVGLHVQVRSDPDAREPHAVLPERTNPVFRPDTGPVLAQICRFPVPALVAD